MMRRRKVSVSTDVQHLSEAESMALRKDYVMRKQQAAEAMAQAAAQRQAEREKYL